LPGGFCVRHHDGVRDADVRNLLARADERGSLPRLGGMARAGGVVIVSPRYWAFATTDGHVHEGAMPEAPHATRRIPLLRGLAKLAASMAPLFRGRGVAGRGERAFLVFALVAPLFAVAVPGGLRWPFAVVLTAAILVWLLRGRTLHLHGAEHRAITAVEERSLAATWDGAARPSRFSSRCGTNFAALVMPVTVAAERLWPLPAGAVLTPLAVTLVSLALTMELWHAVQASRHRAARVLLLPGLALQRLTTREPSPAETRVALRAVASVLRRELG
jgi:uncharacterized protein YqhQ